MIYNIYVICEERVCADAMRSFYLLAIWFCTTKETKRNEKCFYFCFV